MAQRRARLRLRYPAGALVALLQRAPAVPAEAGPAAMALCAPWAAVLRAAAAVALGATHSLAGATPLPLQPSSGSPSGTTVASGATVAIAYTVAGTATLPDSWTITGQVPPGLSFSGLAAPGVVNVDKSDVGVLLLTGTPTTAGTYNLTLEAWEGENATEVNSPVYLYQIVVLPSSSNAPSFTVQPLDTTATVGQTATLVAAAGGATSYQWQFDGVDIPGATGATLTLASVEPSDAGTYSIIASNAGGPAFSRNATLTVVDAANAPEFTQQPAPQSVATSSTVVFGAAATGTPVPTFQWEFNGAPLPGATGPTLVLPAVSAANAGLYNLVATNSGGSVSSNQANLTLVTTASPGRLINLSVETIAGQSQLLTMGFVTGGAGAAGSQSLLIRATGPSLAGFGVGGVLADPTLSVYGGAVVVAANDNWGNPAANAAAVTAVGAALGAFPLSSPSSLDAALVTSLSPGPYSVQISGNDPGTGAVLAELYDATPAGAFTPATPQLINVSCVSAVPAQGTLSAGFVIGGVTARTVLIRAVGPSLASFGVAGVMPNPTLALHGSVNGQDTVLAANAGWGGDPQIAAVMAGVDAFPLPPASRDSVLLGTYSPGLYSAVVTSASGTQGAVLIEVYEVP